VAHRTDTTQRGHMGEHITPDAETSKGRFTARTKTRSAKIVGTHVEIAIPQHDIAS